jgi:hypothetical protein
MIVALTVYAVGDSGSAKNPADGRDRQRHNQTGACALEGSTCWMDA